MGRIPVVFPPDLLSLNLIGKTAFGFYGCVGWGGGERVQIAKILHPGVFATCGCSCLRQAAPREVTETYVLSKGEKKRKIIDFLPAIPSASLQQNAQP